MKKEIIYIVEDDETILKLLSHHLEKKYQVVGVQNFRAVSQEIKEIQPDIVLMDISLPYYNGFYWTTEIRKSMTMPILFISSSDDQMDAVMAMNMGGDDYVTKPFSLEILDAKIAAFLRRVQKFSTLTPNQNLEVADYQLSIDGRLHHGQASVQLTPIESRILRQLFQEEGQVVSKDELLRILWEDENFIDQNTLNVHMTRLRKKVAEVGFDRIHTVRGVGYLIK